MSDGRVFSGCNVENAVFGATVCAERVAIWKAISSEAREIEALAVVTASGGAPCGTCRQVLSEFAAPGTLVAVATADGDHEALTLGELLPRAWGANDLAADDNPA
jgi:cytidine deaminase